MFGVCRFCASTLMWASGVWNSCVIIPTTTEMSFGTWSRTTMSRKLRYSVSRLAAVTNRSLPIDVPRFSGW